MYIFIILYILINKISRTNGYMWLHRQRRSDCAESYCGRANGVGAEEHERGREEAVDVSSEGRERAKCAKGNE
jgi:hypothetical protein